MRLYAVVVVAQLINQAVAHNEQYEQVRICDFLLPCAPFCTQTMACCRAAALPEQCMSMCDLRGTLQRLTDADIMVVAEWYQPISDSTSVLSISFIRGDNL